MWLPSSDHKYCRKLQMAAPLPNSTHTASSKAAEALGVSSSGCAPHVDAHLIPLQAGLRTGERAVYCSTEHLAPAPVLTGAPSEG